MSNYITEDDIEKQVLSLLDKEPFKYKIIKCNPSPDYRDMELV